MPLLNNLPKPLKYNLPTLAQCKTAPSFVAHRTSYSKRIRNIGSTWNLYGSKAVSRPLPDFQSLCCYKCTGSDWTPFAKAISSFLCIPWIPESIKRDSRHVSKHRRLSLFTEPDMYLDNSQHAITNLLLKSHSAWVFRPIHDRDEYNPTVNVAADNVHCRGRGFQSHLYICSIAA